MSVATILVGRRKEPIIGYVPKNYERKKGTLEIPNNP